VAACVSVIIRDLSHFSILTNKGVASLLCFMFAFNAGLPLSTRFPSNLTSARRSHLGVLSIFALITFTLVSLKYTQVLRSETAFRSFSRNFAGKQNLQAAEDIDRAISESPENAYYLSNKALLLASTLSLKPDFKKFRENKLEFGEEDILRIKSAIKLYDKALELNPGDDCFHHNLGWLYSFLRQPEIAITHFRKAIDISSEVALYHISLGLSYEWSNKQEKALSEYTAAIRLSPGTLDSEFFRELQQRLPQEAGQIVSETTRYFENSVDTVTIQCPTRAWVNYISTQDG